MSFTHGGGQGSGKAFPDPLLNQDTSAAAAHFRDEVAQLEKQQAHDRHAQWKRGIRRLLRINSE